MPNQENAYSFHVSDEPSELCLQARTQFLVLVSRFKPQVISDLWENGFAEFKRAVVRHFANELTEGIEDIKGYFDDQQKRYLEDPNSSYVHLLHRKLEEVTGARPYCSFDVLAERPDLRQKVDQVIKQFLIAIQDALLVKLIQSKLTTEFGEDAVTARFRFYANLAERDEDKNLADVIRTWSQAWNLDAEWCREFAVIVLREWLSHPQLSSVGFYTTEEALQRSAWASATHEVLFASIGSRVNTEIAVYGTSGPQRLKFQWHEYSFERPGFNRLRETQRGYKQRSLAEFELYLSDKRRKALIELLNSDASDLRIEPYYEILKRFTKVLNTHVIETLRVTEESVRKLAKVKRKPSLATHVRWAVEFHVAPRKTLDEIVDFEALVVAAAELLRDSNRNGFSREEITREFSQYVGASSHAVDRALALLVERGVVKTRHEDPTSRVIEALRAEGRDDLFHPHKSIDDERKASAVIKERIDKDYKESGGVVIVRYHFVASTKIREAPDRSVISRAAKDIMLLIGLQAGVRTKQVRKVRK